MTKEIQYPTERTIKFNPDLVAYQCINCGASLDGPGKCNFCNTNYKVVGQETLDTGGIYIRVEPNFPERGYGGSIRDNDKEAEIERGFIDKLKKFYGKGGEDKDAFLMSIIIAADKNGVSIRNRVDKGVVDFFISEQHAKTDNQSNIVRLLPELISQDSFWGDVVAHLASQGKLDLFKKHKKELEIAFGFLVPFDPDNDNSSVINKDTVSKDDDGRENNEGKSAWSLMKRLLFDPRSDE